MKSAAKPDFDTTQATRDVLRAQASIAAYRRRPWWRRYTIQSYRLWKLAYRLGLTKEPW